MNAKNRFQRDLFDSSEVMFSASENSLPLVEANKKGGRPRKRATERKTKTVCVHFSDLEYYVVKSRSKNANLKPGNFCRAMILNSHVVAALNKEETELLRNICAIGNNLNQLAHSANLTGTLSLEKEIRDVLNLFKNLINRFSNDRKNNQGEKF